MFDFVCMAIVAWLYTKTARQYDTAAFVVFMGFALHYTAWGLGIVVTDVLNPVWIYVVYMGILALMFFHLRRHQMHFTLAVLLFASGANNLFTILHHLQFTTVNFHGSFVTVNGIIMVLEILYLIRITKYVDNYKRKYGAVDTHDIDRTFFIHRRVHDRGVL